MPTEACSEELETLGAIFLEDLSIETCSESESVHLSTVLYPSTGGDKESRYVTLTLEIELCSEYPDLVPKIRFRNPRGLCDGLLAEMEAKMIKKCEELLGTPMLFEIMDMAKEYLTTNNRPGSECPICLVFFSETDVFYRTKCFHYFHSYCLAKYLNLEEKEYSEEEEALLKKKIDEKSCPVCRKSIVEQIDVNSLAKAPPLSGEVILTTADAEAALKKWNEERTSRNLLFQKQKRQKGIIHLSTVDKNVLVISSPRSRNQGGRQVKNSESVVSTMPTSTSQSKEMANRTEGHSKKSRCGYGRSFSNSNNMGTKSKRDRRK